MRRRPATSRCRATWWARPSTWRPSRCARASTPITASTSIRWASCSTRCWRDAPPVVGEHFSGLMLDIMQRDPPPLHTLRTDVPRRLAGVIHRALARDLDRRFPDMPSFIMAVEAVGRDELKLAMGTPPEGLITQLAMPRLTPDAQFPVPKDRRGVHVAVAIGLAVVAGVTWLWLDARHAPLRQDASVDAQGT